jgi:hypothetical protein
MQYDVRGLVPSVAEGIYVRVYLCLFVSVCVFCRHMYMMIDR